MKFGLALLLFLFGGGVHVFAQNTVWKSEDLKRVEIQNWSDLFTLSSFWNNFTSDNVGIQYSRNGLAGKGGAWWPVFVNGTQVQTQAWDTQSLYLMPISIFQVDSIVIAEDPQIYKGTFIDKGGIFIYTKPVQEGWGVQGNLSFGNKSGDPGPFVYTDRVTPNVERVGPVTDGTISYRQNNFSIQVSGSKFYHAASDNFLQYRRLIPFEYGEGSRWRQVKIESTSGYIKSDLKTGKVSHQLQLGGTEAEDYFFTGIYGVEIPVERSLLFGGYELRGEVKEKLNYEAGLGYNNHQIDGFPNKYDYSLFWNQESWEGRTSMIFRHEQGYQEAGARIDYLSLVDDQSSSKFSTQIVRLHHGMSHQIQNWLRLESHLQLSFANKAALKEKLLLSSRISKNLAFDIGTVYSERLPAEDNSLAFWIKKGFAPAELLPLLGNNAAFRKPNLIKHFSTLKTTLDPLKVNVGLEWISHKNEYLIDHDIQPMRGGVIARNQNLITNHQATFFRIPVSLQWKTGKMLHMTDYMFTHRFSGSEKFYSMIPDHRFNYTINWMPANTFKIWLRIQAQSEVNWAIMQAIDGHTVRGTRLGVTTTGTYQTSYPARFLVDLGIKKYFWDNRINLSMDLRNISDHHFRYSPVSEEHRFTLFLKAGVELP